MLLASGLFPLVIRMSFRDAHVNRSDSCELSTQSVTNHEGQMTGVHGMGGYWTGLDHQRWPANPDGVATPQAVLDKISSLPCGWWAIADYPASESSRVGCRGEFVTNLGWPCLGDAREPLENEVHSGLRCIWMSVRLGDGERWRAL